MDYKAELQSALKRYKQLETQKAAIEIQMQGMVRVIHGLQVLAGEEVISTETPGLDLEGSGLTDSILSVLEHAGASTPTEIRDALEEYGYSGQATGDPESPRKNLLINVHTVLRRLKKAGRVDETTKHGKTAYQHVSDSTRRLREAFGFDLMPK